MKAVLYFYIYFFSIKWIIGAYFFTWPNSITKILSQLATLLLKQFMDTFFHFYLKLNASFDTFFTFLQVSFRVFHEELHWSTEVLVHCVFFKNLYNIIIYYKVTHDLVLISFNFYKKTFCPLLLTNRYWFLGKSLYASLIKTLAVLYVKSSCSKVFFVRCFIILCKSLLNLLMQTWWSYFSSFKCKRFKRSDHFSFDE